MNNTRVSTNHCLSAGVAGSREFARVSGYELDLSPARSARIRTAISPRFAINIF